jgi:hypothetical protein
MPLDPVTLRLNIKSQLEPLIASETKKAFHDAMQKFRDVSAQQIGNKGINVFESANNEASIVFSDIMKNLAEDIASVVSTNVDIFIKGGDVTVLVNGVTVGAPAPHTIVSQPGTGKVL